MKNRNGKTSFSTLLSFPLHIIRSLFFFFLSALQYVPAPLVRAEQAIRDRKVQRAHIPDMKSALKNVMYYIVSMGYSILICCTAFGVTFLSRKRKKPVNFWYCVSDPRRKCISKCLKPSSSIQKHARVEKHSLK